MQVEIVTIGNEVLSGRTLDTNFAFLARALEEASVAVAWHSTVSDSAERIAEGLTRALDHSWRDLPKAMLAVPSALRDHPTTPRRPRGPARGAHRHR